MMTSISMIAESEVIPADNSEPIDQLALSLKLPKNLTLDNYFPGKNGPIKAIIENLLWGESPKLVYLWGGTGVGKTHLLQALCHTASLEKYPAMYLPLADADKLEPEILEDLESIAILCIDDLHCLAQLEDIGRRQAWQSKLAEVIESRPRENLSLLLASADGPENYLKIVGDDPSVVPTNFYTQQLVLLTEAEKLMALQLTAESRGLQLSEPVARYILKACDNNMQQAFYALGQVDQIAYLQKRAINLPFVKQLFEIDC